MATIDLPINSADTESLSLPELDDDEFARQKMPTALYVVAMPLGNRFDITARARHVLAVVDLIAAEDTRHSGPLLRLLGISSPLLAAHEHNELAAAEQIINCLGKGGRVALISDAGTPAISDPGTRIVRAVRAAGWPVVPVPGPSAVVAALSVAGLAEGPFFFQGFLPVKTAARCRVLETLLGLNANLVFYEAPHRLAECLADMAAVFGAEAELFIGRELTKRFEQTVCLPLSEATAWLAADSQRQRGEFVLVLRPVVVQVQARAEAEQTLRLLLAELPLKTAVQLAAKLSGESKNSLYQQALLIKKEESTVGVVSAISDGGGSDK